jgi:putative nucleotidyltransferase with HDIG domain
LTATELVSGVGSLPGLPGIVFRLQSAIQEEGVSFASVAQIIERDPAMTARLLKAANSAFFGVRTEVRTAEQALVLLGVHTVRNLLVVTSLHGTLRRFRLAPQFRLVRYWEHSLVTAVVAKVLALHVPRVATDDAFVCGLLHDIGKVAMASLFFDERAVVLTPSAFSDREIEQSLFGCDHTEIGAALAEQWRLPALLCAARLRPASSTRRTSSRTTSSRGTRTTSSFTRSPITSLSR